MTQNNIAEGGCLPDDPYCGKTRDEGSAGKTTTSVIPTPATTAAATPKRGVLSTVLTALGELDVSVMRNKDGRLVEYSSRDGGRVSVVTGGNRKNRMEELERMGRNRQQDFANERVLREEERRRLEAERQMQRERRVDARQTEQMEFERKREQRLAEESNRRMARQKKLDDIEDEKQAVRDSAFERLEQSASAPTGTQQLGKAYEALDLAVRANDTQLAALAEKKIEAISSQRVTLPDGTTVPFYEVGIALASEVDTPAWGLAAKKVLLQNGLTEDESNEAVKSLQNGSVGYKELNEVVAGSGTALENAVSNSRHHSGNLAQYKQRDVQNRIRNEYAVIVEAEDTILKQMEMLQGSKSHGQALKHSKRYAAAFEEYERITKIKQRLTRQILGQPPPTEAQILDATPESVENGTTRPVDAALTAANAVKNSPEGYAAVIPDDETIWEEFQYTQKQLAAWAQENRTTEAIPTRGGGVDQSSVQVLTPESEAARKKTLNDFAYRYLGFMYQDPNLELVPVEAKQALMEAKSKGWWNIPPWKRDAIVDAAFRVADEMVEGYKSHSNGTDMLVANTREAKAFSQKYLAPFKGGMRQPNDAEIRQMVARKLGPDFMAEGQQAMPTQGELNDILEQRFPEQELSPAPPSPLERDTEIGVEEGGEEGEFRRDALEASQTLPRQQGESVGEAAKRIQKEADGAYTKQIAEELERARDDYELTRLVIKSQPIPADADSDYYSSDSDVEEARKRYEIVVNKYLNSTGDDVPKVQRPPFYDDDDEAKFLDWYTTISSQLGLNSDPDSEGHQYDYREYWANEVKGKGSSAAKKGDHFLSKYKLALHPDRFLLIDGVFTDTVTGKAVAAND